MKLILDGPVGGSVRIAAATPLTMAALTNGGYGQLPGDAITADLSEDIGRRAEAATAMPAARARDNMVRAGHAPDFVDHWLSALLVGGETDASGLDLVRRKTFMDAGDQVAIDALTIPSSRALRDAWRREGDGIVIDLPAARVVFARRVIAIKRDLAVNLTDEIESLMLAGEEAGALEASYAALGQIDLKALGAEMAKASSPSALLALWPAALAA